jgi:hypothetical protein
MNTLKSIGAVVAGFITVAILSVGTDFVLETLKIFPPSSEPQSYTSGMLMVALIYRCVYTLAGGYLTAVLAPSRPMRHVIILGIIGLVVGTLGTAANWDKAVASGTWYAISVVILSPLCVWFGGRMKTGSTKEVQV